MKFSIGKIIKWIGLCLLVGLLVVVTIPGFIRPRVTYSTPACINNLHQIDVAKNQWAAENNKTNGTVVTENDIRPYLKLNAKSDFPQCPEGGTYIIGKVGENPICSLGTDVTPAHVLP